MLLTIFCACVLLLLLLLLCCVTVECILAADWQDIEVGEAKHTQASSSSWGSSQPSLGSRTVRQATGQQIWRLLLLGGNVVILAHLLVLWMHTNPNWCLSTPSFCGQ